MGTRGITRLLVAVTVLGALLGGGSYLRARALAQEVRSLLAQVEQLSAETRRMGLDGDGLPPVSASAGSGEGRLDGIQRISSASVTDKIRFLATNHRIAGDSGQWSAKIFDVCWFELEGLLYAAALGVEPLDGVPEWTAGDPIPQDIGRILAGEHLGIMDEVDIRYVAIEFDSPMAFAGRQAVALVLLTERGMTTTSVYLRDESQDWFVAKSRLRARFMEAYIEDGHPDTGD